MLRIYGAREYNGNIKIDVGIEYNFKIGWKVVERLETSLDRSRKSIDKEYRMTNEREKVSSSIPKVHFIDDNKDDTLSSIKTKREVFLSKRLGQYIFFSFNSYGPSSSQRSTEVNKEFGQKGQAFFHDSNRFYRAQFFNSSRYSIPKNILP